jgi:hypothetical protein
VLDPERLGDPDRLHPAPKKLATGKKTATNRLLMLAGSRSSSARSCATVWGMAFDANVGVLLADAAMEHTPEFLAVHELVLACVNRELALRGLPPHREPRSVAEVHPPLRGDQATRLGRRLGFYGDDKYDRLECLAIHVAVLHAVPPVDASMPVGVWERYEALPDRAVAFDHLLAMLRLDTVLLPRALPGVILVEDGGGDPEIRRIASAPRLHEECVLLANVLRYFDPNSREYTSFLDSPEGNPRWRGLRSRIEDDDAVVQAWANEADLCWRLIQVAGDSMRIHGMAVTC